VFLQLICVAATIMAKILSLSLLLLAAQQSVAEEAGKVLTAYSLQKPLLTIIST
jgi:hypothetical protein